MPLSDQQSLMALVGVAAFSVFMLVYLFATSRPGRLDERIEELAGQTGGGAGSASLKGLAHSASTVGAMLIPKKTEDRGQLQKRLIHAGYYGPHAMATFLGIKVLLLIGPMLVGGALGLLGQVPVDEGLLYGALGGAMGLVGPSFWLDKRKTQRQMEFRRALPDAMDVLVIVLEGGGSLPQALQRVAGELRVAHPDLSDELAIVLREMQLGSSVGGALRHFGDRVDLEEVRSLAAVIIQVERYGASLVKALRVHAETFRQKRLVRAEELAQKASLKMLFPTVVCIFPAMFIVILGPTVLEVIKVFNGMQ